MKLLLLTSLPALVLCGGVPPPEGPQGPSGVAEKYDLLTGSFPDGRLGAFNTVEREPGATNEEVQWYVGDNAVQGGISIAVFGAKIRPNVGLKPD